MVKGRGQASGVSIVEAIVTLLLLCLLLPMIWSVFSRYRSAGLDVAARSERLETLRTLAWLLPEEVDQGRPGVDWQLMGEDSLDLRAFRGLGLVDTSRVQLHSMNVCFRGLRQPAPEKDSVLLLGMDGRWRAHDLVDRSSLGSTCADGQGWKEENWILSPEPGPAVLARLFEHGSYHLVAGALRYRRGGGGRQPLTPEHIRSGRLFRVEPGRGPLAWEVRLRGPTRSRGESEAVEWRGTTW